MQTYLIAETKNQFELFQIKHDLEIDLKAEKEGRMEVQPTDMAVSLIENSYEEEQENVSGTSARPDFFLPVCKRLRLMQACVHRS